MKVPYSKILSASFALALFGLSASAQTGIGTTTPRSMLDVNGAISVAETTAAVASNAATIPTGFSLVRLTGTATAAVTLTAAASPVPVAGQLLTIFNTTTFAATFSGQTIGSLQSLNLVYSNGSWQGTAGGIGNPTTASNGLTKTGNNIVLGGALTGATDVATAGNNLTFSGTGNVGIGTTTPNASLQFGNTLTNRKIVLYEDGNNDNQVYAFGVNASGQLAYRASNTGADHVFSVGTSATTSNELMRIMGTGKVGIGTSSPTSVLDVNGSTRLRGLTTAGVVTTDASGNLSSSTAAVAVPTTASNGLTKTGNNFALGGTLTGATDVATAGNNLTFSGTGNVGIGTTTPNASLQFGNTLTNRKIVLYEDGNNDNQVYAFGVNASGQLAYRTSNTGADHVFYTGTSATTSNELMRIAGAGKVTITSTIGDYAVLINNGSPFAGGIDINLSGNYTSGAPLMNFRNVNAVIGSILRTAAGGVNYNTTSDIRLKKNIVATHFGLADVLKIGVKDYVYKSDKAANPQTGFLAQQLYSVYPMAVTKGGEDANTNPWQVDYGKLTPLLTKAIQEQQAEIEVLKTDNASLKAANAGLKASLDGKASASTLDELQAALQSLRAEMQTLKAGTSTASTK